MNCEHCLKAHPLDCGIAHALHRLFGAAGRAWRSAVSSFAQLG
jgi:hypothetical protein